MSFSDQFFSEVISIADTIDKNGVERLVSALANTRDYNEGRVFVLGVNDLRKLCGIEAYAPTDNASEVTARTNDEGFDTVFVEYLKVSRLNHLDTIFILSVGGGDEERNVSVGLIKAIKLAKSVDATVVGIVGKNDGYTASNSDVCLVVPPLFPDRITPHSEAFQAVVWHCIVSHPKLQINQTKW